MSRIVRNASSLLSNASFVLARFQAEAPVPELAPHLDALRSAHEALAASAKRATHARAALSAALARVKGAREALLASVDALAEGLTKADVTPRRDPFQGLSSVPPSRFATLRRALREKEVEALVANVRVVAPASLAPLADACHAALEALTREETLAEMPRHALEVAAAERDALAAELATRGSDLRVHARAALNGDKARLASLFAPMTPKPAAPDASALAAREAEKAAARAAKLAQKRADKAAARAAVKAARATAKAAILAAASTRAPAVRTEDTMGS